MNRTALPQQAPPLSIGQLVSVFAEPGSWLNGRTGTVKTLPRRNGLLREDQIAVEIDGATPLGPSPVRWMDPRRVAPLSTCETCALGGGCMCEIRDPNAGCEHYGCWGPRQTYTCPGVAVERARHNAWKFARFGAVA